MPEISVIIPVLQEEKLIAQTLKAFSAFRDDFAIEIIVSDGGSTDKTVEIARQFADVIVESLPDDVPTIAAGRNRGAAVASGSIFLFINGDTIPADAISLLSAVKNWADKIESSAIALACPVQISPDERLFSDILFHGFYNRYVIFLNRIGYGIGRGECQIVRAEMFRKVGGYNDYLVAGEDFDLYQRLAKHGKIRTFWETTVFESPRRFRELGYLRTLWLWTLNALSVKFRGTAASKEWTPLR